MAGETIGRNERDSEWEGFVMEFKVSTGVDLMGQREPVQIMKPGSLDDYSGDKEMMSRAMAGYMETLQRLTGLDGTTVRDNKTEFEKALVDKRVDIVSYAPLASIKGIEHPIVLFESTTEPLPQAAGVDSA